MKRTAKATPGKVNLVRTVKKYPLETIILSHLVDFFKTNYVFITAVNVISFVHFYVNLSSNVTFNISIAIKTNFTIIMCLQGH